MQRTFAVQPLEPIVAPYGSFCMSFSPGWFLLRAAVSGITLGIGTLAYCLTQ